MSLKVFQLAKQLGVDSKKVVQKCKDEGMPSIDTHMSAVTAGQAETIREWFSEGAPQNAVEATEHVDVIKARATTRKRPSRAKNAATGATGSSDSGGDGQSATAVAEPPGESIANESGTMEGLISAPETQTETAQDRGVSSSANVESVAPAPTHKAAVHAPEAPPAAPAPEAPRVPQVPVKPVRPVAPVQPRGVVNVVAKPTVVPAGIRNVPAPAQLQGPKVVRVEQPDNLPAPRARPRPPAQAPVSNTPVGPGGAIHPTAFGAAPATPGAHGRSRARGDAPVIVDDEETAAKKAKGRSSRRHGGRSADAGDFIRELREADLAERTERLAHATGGVVKGRRRELNKTQQRAQNQQHSVAERPTEVEIFLPVTLRELSEAIGIKSSDILKKLVAQGVMATVNQSIDADTAQSLALEFGVELKIKERESSFAVLERQFKEREEAAEKILRPAVVTILGHVDHGKTSLLDKIRSANVAAGEAGGITQHVGAYTVNIPGSDGKEKRVTFLDTPGHQAFTAMRARGANMTDVVVLVVSADDGVMPQTVESINHAKAAGVPIVVALNKIDKAEANPNKVLGQLAEQGLNPAEWGGDTEVVRTSAVTGQGVKELIEYLDYVATLRELKAAPQLPARGAVIEAFMDPLRGVVARVLVQNGTLHIGDVLVCGSSAGRVRSLVDDKGKSIKEAGPATPVEVIGLDGVPTSGDRFYVMDDFNEAKSMAEERRQGDRDNEIARRNKVTLENLFDTIKQGDVKELAMILKADVQGSVDVLRQMMTEELSKEVKVRLLHSAVGGISESDVLLAEASGAIIVGFSVVPDETARKMAEERGVEIRLYRIIYEITDDIRKALTGMLDPSKQDQILGHAEVRQVIKISRVGNVAGVMVTDGVLQRANKYRLIRDGAVVTENLLLESLKRFKEDVKEVRGGMECGIKIDGYDDVKVGDRMEAYKTVDVARTL